MKIFKEGKLPVVNERFFWGNCPHCGCTFEVSLTEINECLKSGTNPRKFERTFFPRTYPCPTFRCNMNVELNERGV